MLDNIDTSDMILPDDFQMPAEGAPGDGADNTTGNEPAQPEAGLQLPGGDPSGSTNPGADGQQGDTTPPADGQDGQPPEKADTPDGTKPADGEKPTDQQTIKVKYNHQEMELPVDQAVPLIQKGMNYDKLQSQLVALQNDPRVAKVDKVMEISKLLGYQSEDALLDALYETYYTNTAAAQGITVEQAKMDAELKQREAALRQIEQQTERQKAENAMYERFLAAYPDAKPTDIKPETWALVRQGLDLTAAFARQRTAELEAQMKIMQQNMKNANTAPVGSVTQHGAAAAAAQDPFLMGFDSEL